MAHDSRIDGDRDPRHLRLFVALEIPDDVRAAIEGVHGGWHRGAPPARWVRPEAWHVTLAFLGAVPAEGVPALGDALAPVFAGRETFRLHLSGGGTFPPRRPARVLWLGLEDEPRGALEELQAGVAQALAVAGHPLEERPFHGHLTLARCARPWPRAAVERFVDASADPPGEPFVVRRGVLFESRLEPGGARYSVQTAFPLAPLAMEARP